jgi:hypothetical protein
LKYFNCLNFDYLFIFNCLIHFEQIFNFPYLIYLLPISSIFSFCYQRQRSNYGIYSNEILYNYNNVYWEIDNKKNSIIHNFIDSILLADLLNQLSPSTKCDYNTFVEYCKKLNETHVIFVIEQDKNIIVTGTLFIEKTEDRLTIQKVPKKIYKASYCCWFLSESKFLSLFKDKYDLVYDFDISERININSKFKMI